MILYWNEGKRWYGRNPVPVYRRVGWEFQFFVSGSCEMIGSEGRTEPVHAGTLWVFPPSTPHGWGGNPKSECEIRVVHYSRVREPLGELCLRKGLWKAELSALQMNHLERVFQDTGRAFRDRSILLDLHAERLLLELSLTILSGEPEVSKAGLLAQEERIVGSAISYYRDHMHLHVSMEEVAAAVFVSPSHLRRLFHRVKGVSPRQWFQEERILRAEEMLKETTYTLDRIAESCGFESGGSLIRAFRSIRGITPHVFRERNQGQRET
ncbi:MAG: hypothetical protein Kow009_03230 [Spirochaetales bacterium]